jgi:hypothetical protein
VAKKKFVYFFGNGKADGAAGMKNLLGGKGANIAEMTNIGIPVPAGFTITTDVCTYYYEKGHKYPPGLKAEVEKALKRVEKAMGAKFGDEKNPLLVSCRSGARISMPGMMDTVLNIGLNDKTIQGLSPRPAMSALPMTPTAALCTCTATWFWGWVQERRTTIPLRRSWTSHQEKRKGGKLDTELGGRGPQGLVANTRP